MATRNRMTDSLTWAARNRISFLRVRATHNCRKFSVTGQRLSWVFVPVGFFFVAGQLVSGAFVTVGFFLVAGQLVS